MQRRLSNRRRGFTLPELMAVVAIVGLLATLAFVSYRRFVDSARSSEAVHMVSSIRGAQEAYRSEALTYLDVSTSLDAYYPVQTPNDRKNGWGGGTSELARRWRVLNVSTDGSVLYAYATIAGPPGAVRSDGLEIDNPPTFPAAVEPWYLVQAKGDVNGNSVFSYCVASSFTNQLYWQNEGE